MIDDDLECTDSASANKTVVKPSTDKVTNAGKTRIKTTAVNIKQQSELNQRTKLKPRITEHINRATNNQPNQKTNLRPQALSADQENALTRIHSALRNQNSSQGFRNAQKAADLALSGKKIVLNKRFVLETTLGAGGMGTVYRARDLRKVEAQDLNPDIAVKVLNEDFKNHPDAFVTLQREASRSHSLSHPNIVTVHDFDRDGDIFYMTMELLEGEGLESLLSRNKSFGMPVKDALPIIEGYCKALAFVHKKNIVHSDLKPGNIFLTKEGAKVLDFGIARITSQASDPKDWDAGSLEALTPAYASLEMIRHEAPHPSDDVYAAAIIAYELFSGSHPYDRLPADEALAKKLKPKRIPQLTKRQWHALEAALQFERDKRTQKLDEFSDQLTQKKKFPIFKVSSAILSLMTLAFVYLWFFVPDELDLQASSTFDKAQACYSQQDYACAADGAKAVLEMKPAHTDALTLLEKSKTAILDSKIAEAASAFEHCIALDDTRCAREKIREIQTLNPESEALNNAKAALLTYKINHALSKGQNCLEIQNYTCARREANEALAMDAENQTAIALLDSIETKITLQQQAEAESKLRFDQALHKARKCLAQKNYACALEHIANAKAEKPNNATAEALAQKIHYSKIQHEENQKKAKNMIKKGKDCLAIKNYNCAIASADSALELSPSHKQAIKLKAEAKKALNALKSQFTIE